MNTTNNHETNSETSTENSELESIQSDFKVSASRVLMLRSTLKRQIAKLQPIYLKKRLDESDVVQEVSMIACRSLHRFQGKTDTEFMQWLRKMVRKKVRELVRFNVRKRRDVRREVEHQHHEITTQQTDVPVEFGLHESTKINRALLSLPQRNRSVIQMRLLEGMTFVEIGNNIGCSDDAARKIWARSLVQLGKLIEKYDEQADN